MSGECCPAPALARPGEGEAGGEVGVVGRGARVVKKKKSFYGAQMNACRFLFTFDLPLSPPKNDRAKGGWKKGEKGRRREEIQTEGEREGRMEEERKRGEAGELLLLLPPYLLSPSLYFFSFCLSEGKLGAELLLPRLQPPAALLTS